MIDRVPTHQNLEDPMLNRRSVDARTEGRLESSMTRTSSYSPIGPDGPRKDANEPPSVAVLSYGEREMSVYAATMDQRLTPLELRVLIHINHAVGFTSGLAWPKQETLARNLGSTTTRISQAIKALERYGYVQVDRCRRKRQYSLVRQSLVAAAAPQRCPEPAPIEDQWCPVPDTIEAQQCPVPDTIAGPPTPRCPEPDSERCPVPDTLTVNTGTGTEGCSESAPPPDMGATRQRSKRAAAKLVEHSLPEDWQPEPALITDYVNRGLSRTRVLDEIEKFRNHFLGKPSVRRTRWDLACRNWLSNEVPGGKWHQEPPKADPLIRPGNLGLAYQPTDDSAFGWQFDAPT